VPAMASLIPVTPNARSGATVSLRNLEKSFEGRSVLRDLSLEIEGGSFVAIVGRSGCGKTTLLRIAAGLETADHGSVTVDKSNTRLMFQEARLLPWKSVVDNVRIGLPRSARGAAQEALREVGLEDRADSWPAALSGGQRQRVALARALLHRPKLLLLDEPLGALDALTRMEMHTLIERLWRENEFTAVLVTHDVQEAVVLADRVLVMDRGQIAFDQPIDLPRPRSRGSAAFAALENSVLKQVLTQAS
jgi:sulfonate transport system ATP-binding protein